jgi:hypothetical protein
MPAAVVVAAALLAAAFLWGCSRIVASLDAGRDQASGSRTLALLAMFAPASTAAAADPRAVLAWEPVARTARQLFPKELSALDAAAGGRFPWGRERIQDAHAQWTAGWLAWERAHDAEYKLKLATIEDEIAHSEPSAVLRARADVIEREKLELYQRRYQEYVRVAKALQALAG